MHLLIGKTDLARVITSVARVVESRNTIPILSNLRLVAEGNTLTVTGTDLDIVATASAPADITTPGAICVDAKLFADVAKKAGGDISMSLVGDKLNIVSGRAKFSLQTLPASDFPDFAAGKFDATFDIDLAALFAPVAFAISTEETRYYLNGIFFRGDGDAVVAVATDGHRLARNTAEASLTFAGIIVPRKTVGLLPKGGAQVSVSDSKIRIDTAELCLTSKLIDGTFPDYMRVIPTGNDKLVTVDRDAMMKAAERVVTVSSQKGRGVKLSIAPGGIVLSAHSEAGSAEDEVAAEYSGEPFVIGFNSQYVRDIFSVLPSGPVTLKLADAGSPGIITGGLEGWDGVLMPYRV